MAIGSVTSPPTPPAGAQGDAASAASRPVDSSVAVASTRRASARRSRHRDRIGYLPALALGIAAVAFWQLITASAVVAAFVLPAPVDVLRSFWQSLTDGLLWSYTATTLTESVAGFALGTLIALPLGYAVAKSSILAKMLEPYIAASQALPAVALAPLLVLWIGYGVPPVAILCALIVFFPATITTTLGLRLLDRDVVDAARVEGAGRWALLWHIEAPLALPSVLAGLRASLTYSITGAVVGEFVLGDQGLGGLLNVARGNFDIPLVFATLLMLALLAAVMYGIARLAERWLSYLEA
jgi:NitT/TauT family transport system permease protein